MRDILKGGKRRMRKSKHFRKDVIIARIIAAIILIILMVIVHSLISVLFKPSGNKDKFTQNIGSDYNPNGNLNHGGIKQESSENTEADVLSYVPSATNEDSEIVVSMKLKFLNDISAFICFVETSCK